MSKNIEISPDKAKEICAYLNDHKYCLLEDAAHGAPLFSVHEIEDLMESLLIQDGFPEKHKKLWLDEIKAARRARGMQK